MAKKLVQKAVNGNRKAMTALYHADKQTVYAVARLLLQNEAKAAMAVQWVYKNIFDHARTENTADAAAFSRLAVMMTVSYCKRMISNQNSRAFRIPDDRRFDVTGALSEADNTTEAVLAAMTDLQRLLIVLRTVGQGTNEELMAASKLDARTLLAATSAEKVNVEHLLYEKGDEPSYEAFVKLLKNERNIAVPKETEEAVLIRFAQECAPLEKKHRRKAFWTTVISAACCIAVAVSAWLIWYVSTHPTEEPITDADQGVTQIEATHMAEIVVQGYGTIKVDLDANTAPQTVANFQKLADQGFYDNLTFHRIMSGFMIQGGDPQGNGTGGSDEPLYGEFTNNGFENNLSHTRGAISMARRDGDNNSASSQFFIVHQDSTFLDGDYAVFGYVTEGMDIVDQICADAEPTDDNGTIPAEKQPIIAGVFVTEL